MQQVLQTTPGKAERMAEASEAVAAYGDGVIGRMVCVDYGGCDAIDVLCDEATLKGVMDQLCEEIGIRVISNASNSFGPGAGVTSVNVLATSSLSVHTWPELGTACVDLFSCRTDFEDEFVDRFFADAFGATSSARTGFDRVQPARTPGSVRA